jgi:hypothetical protein
MAGQFKLVPASLTCGQPVRDRFLPVFNSAHQVRPDKFNCKPDKNGEGHRLGKKRQVDIHG